MKHDPQGEARRWLAQARAELSDARLLLEHKRFYLVLYLCQQAAEKALKAFLIANDEPHVMSHSVRDLLEYAAEIDSTLVQLKSARRLDDYYIPTRYPNGLPGGVPSQYYDDVDEAKDAVSLCDSVVTGVAERLGLVE